VATALEVYHASASRLPLREVLILASSSPRRRELLTAAGIQFEVRAAGVDEMLQAGEQAPGFVQRLAKEKAGSVEIGSGDIVLGADTVVCIEGVVLGKPADPADAVRMLRSLAGRSHWVYTGFCLRSTTNSVVDYAGTEVTFSDLTNCEIAEYVQTGEPFDKAGAYAIQGLASKFVLEIWGCYQNVMGLPVSRVYRHLRDQAFASLWSAR
jgi:septum formation protein